MTTACYRNAFAKHFGGIDAYYSPFIAASDINKVSHKLLKDILPECNDASVKLIPQLLGNDGDQFKAYACVISDMGYNEINWNIGCPFPMVTNKKRGSGILPYPDMIKKFLDTACSNSSYVVTVKMRLGLNNTEDGIQAMNILNQYPLDGVIIHARTGKQMYSGKVALDAFYSLSAACRHEITYNGDIFTYDSFLSISSRFPHIKNFMLGRGALSDPFLPSLIKGHPIPSNQKNKLVRDFHNEIFEYYQNRLSGEKHLCDKMKEFWDFMHVHLDRDGKLMKKIKKCSRTSEYLEVINQIFDPDAVWKDI
jgi:tRNA-dihydrouridine synthase